MSQWSVARDALQNAAEDLQGMSEDYQTSVVGGTNDMGQVSWPIMMAFCQGPYNTSLDQVRDAAGNTGEAVSAVATKIQEIKAAYETLEANGQVK